MEGDLGIGGILLVCEPPAFASLRVSLLLTQKGEGWFFCAFN